MKYECGSRVVNGVRQSTQWSRVEYVELGKEFDRKQADERRKSIEAACHLNDQWFSFQGYYAAELIVLS